MNSLTRFANFFDVRDNPARVAPPDESSRLESFGVGPDRRTTPFGFADFDEAKQRGLIRDHLRKWPCDGGLLGEAINEHRLAGSIQEAFLSGDVVQLGKLVDRAMREYLGAEYERTKEAGDA